MCIFMCICTYLRACSLNVIVETRQEIRSSIFSFALQINLVLCIFCRLDSTLRMTSQDDFSSFSYITKQD